MLAAVAWCLIFVCLLWIIASFFLLASSPLLLLHHQSVFIFEIASSIAIWTKNMNQVERNNSSLCSHFVQPQCGSVFALAIQTLLRTDEKIAKEAKKASDKIKYYTGK